MSARYDAVAAEYASAPDSYDDPVSKALFDLIWTVAGRRVLDLACGHGRIAREIARRGAEVVGIDISEVLLAKARELEEAKPLGIRYVHGGVTTRDALLGETFDAVVCSFGLTDIDDLDGAIATVSRALKPDGPFVFSMLHPCFPAGRMSLAHGRPMGVITSRSGGSRTAHCRC